jgi:hypothetical protein
MNVRILLLVGRMNDPNCSFSQAIITTNATRSGTTAVLPACPMPSPLLSLPSPHKRYPGNLVHTHVCVDHNGDLVDGIELKVGGIYVFTHVHLPVAYITHSMAAYYLKVPYSRKEKGSTYQVSPQERVRH